MQTIAILSRSAVLCVAMFLAIAVQGEVRNQPATPSSPGKPAALDEPNQAELLESYRYLREQLRAAQLAIVNNRAEAEATARIQSAAVAAKLDAIKVSMAEVNKRQLDEATRLEWERDRRDEEMQRMNRTAIWVASAVGAMGLLAIVVIVHFQSRAMNRIADAVSSHPQLLAQQAWMPVDLASPPAEAPSQRLMSVIERMDKRILELEHIGTDPERPRRPLR